MSEGLAYPPDFRIEKVPCVLTTIEAAAFVYRLRRGLVRGQRRRLRRRQVRRLRRGERSWRRGGFRRRQVRRLRRWLVSRQWRGLVSGHAGRKVRRDRRQRRGLGSRQMRGLRRAASPRYFGLETSAAQLLLAL